MNISLSAKVSCRRLCWYFACALTFVSRAAMATEFGWPGVQLEMNLAQAKAVLESQGFRASGSARDGFLFAFADPVTNRPALLITGSTQTEGLLYFARVETSQALFGAAHQAWLEELAQDYDPPTILPVGADGSQTRVYCHSPQVLLRLSITQTRSSLTYVANPRGHPECRNGPPDPGFAALLVDEVPEAMPAEVATQLARGETPPEKPTALALSARPLNGFARPDAGSAPIMAGPRVQVARAMPSLGSPGRTPRMEMASSAQAPRARGPDRTTLQPPFPALSSARTLTSAAIDFMKANIGRLGGPSSPESVIFDGVEPHANQAGVIYAKFSFSYKNNNDKASSGETRFWIEDGAILCELWALEFECQPKNTFAPNSIPGDCTSLETDDFDAPVHESRATDRKRKYCVVKRDLGSTFTDPIQTHLERLLRTWNYRLIPEKTYFFETLREIRRPKYSVQKFKYTITGYRPYETTSFGVMSYKNEKIHCLLIGRQCYATISEADARAEQQRYIDNNTPSGISLPKASRECLKMETSHSRQRTFEEECMRKSPSSTGAVDCRTNEGYQVVASHQVRNVCSKPIRYDKVCSGLVKERVVLAPGETSLRPEEGLLTRAEADSGCTIESLRADVRDQSTKR